MTFRTSSTLAALLGDLRHHPAFPELIKAIPEPPLQPFKISEASEVEKARARWIYESGRRAHYDYVMTLLTGQTRED